MGLERDAVRDGPRGRRGVAGQGGSRGGANKGYECWSTAAVILRPHWAPTLSIVVTQVVWRHPGVIAQRSKLPLAEWGGRCIGQEACSYVPASDESAGRPVRRTDVCGSAYNDKGCLLFARDALFECNGSSSCARDCFNRVVGRGVSAKLQVFKTFGRGFGVRCQHMIPAGSFVCEYTGEILLDTDAEIGRAHV